MGNKDKHPQTELPTVSKAMEQLMTPGTILGGLKYPEKPIVFKNSPQSAVKSLAVKICSTETIDEAILHQLHTQTRTA